MSRRWTGRGRSFALGCLVSAITLLGASAPNAFADTSPINGVTTTVDATNDEASSAVDNVVTSDITDPVQETSVGESVDATTDPAMGETSETLIADTGAAGTTGAAPDAVSGVVTDVVSDETSQDPVGVTDAASETPEAPQEAPPAVEATVADVSSATPDEDAATRAIAATPDSVTETRSDTVDENSDATADATIGTISAVGGSDEQPSLDATVATPETTSDVAAMITTSEVAAPIGDATAEAVSLVESLATVVDMAARSAADLTPGIVADVTVVESIGSAPAAAVAEAIADTAGMIADVAAEATASTESIAQTAVREASAITVEPSPAIVDASADATWATFETVATEAAATVSDVTSLETVTGASSTVADATNTVSFAGATADTISEAAVLTIDAMTEGLGTAAHTVGVASETTTDTVGAEPDGASDAVATLSEAVSAVIAAVSGDGALADPTTVLNGASETTVSGLDPASLQRLQGGSPPMRDGRFRLSVNRGQTEGERFQGNEPVAPCEDASSLNCTFTGSPDGIDSLVESVASIIKILALTGLTLLPWVAAAGMLASLGGLAFAASRRRRATGSLPETAHPREGHVKDAWAYS
jgi:hypothetical protein